MLKKRTEEIYKGVPLIKSQAVVNKSTKELG
jgi:hypothetical protein